MKSLVVLAAAGFLLVSGTLGSAAASRTSQHSTATSRGWVLALPSVNFGHIRLGRAVVPMQSGPANTPTPTPTTTSGNQYPDAQTVLQSMFDTVGLLKYEHFDEIADHVGQVNLHVDATGDAACKGPALKAKVVGTASVPGTAQSEKTQFQEIQYANSYFWKSKATKQTWQPVKPGPLSKKSFGFLPDNPLSCPSASGGSSTGGGNSGTQDTIKDLQNLGPETYGGQQVWHIHATDVQLDTTSNTTSELPLDWYVGQSHPLLYGFVITSNDPANNVKESLTYKLSKFGKAVKISKPKKGAKRP